MFIHPFIMKVICAAVMIKNLILSSFGCMADTMARASIRLAFIFLCDVRDYSYQCLLIKWHPFPIARINPSYVSITACATHHLLPFRLYIDDISIYCIVIHSRSFTWNFFISFFVCDICMNLRSGSSTYFFSCLIIHPTIRPNNTHRMALSYSRSQLWLDIHAPDLGWFLGVIVWFIVRIIIV